jgi:flagellar protein FlaF
MGFSVSGATLILLIGLLLSVGVLVPTVADSIDDISSATKDQQDTAIGVYNTDIEVSATTFDFGTDTFTVSYENTGVDAIEISDIDFLLDGEYTAPSRTTVEGETQRETVVSGETVVVEFSTPVEPTRLKTVLPTGQSIVMVT